MPDRKLISGKILKCRAIDFCRIFRRQLANIYIIQCDPSLSRLIQPAYQFHNCRLSRTIFPYQRNFLKRFYGKGNILQHLFGIIRISKGNIMKLQTTLSIHCLAVSCFLHFLHFRKLHKLFEIPNIDPWF